MCNKYHICSSRKEGKNWIIIVYSGSHVWMWELDHKEGWVPNIWCFWTVVLEKTLESPLDSLGNTLMLKQKIQYFGHLIWRTDSQKKTLMLGKIEGGRRRGWQRIRWLDGITDSMDVSLSLGIGDGQGSLACYSPWDHKESDMTEQLNWTGTCMVHSLSL